MKLWKKFKEWFFGTERKDFDYDKWYDTKPEDIDKVYFNKKK